MPVKHTGETQPAAPSTSAAGTNASVSADTSTYTSMDAASNPSAPKLRSTSGSSTTSSSNPTEHSNHLSQVPMQSPSLPFAEGVYPPAAAVDGNSEFHGLPPPSAMPLQPPLYGM